MNTNEITISGTAICCVPLPWGVMVSQNRHNIDYVAAGGVNPAMNQNSFFTAFNPKGGCSHVRETKKLMRLLTRLMGFIPEQITKKNQGVVVMTVGVGEGGGEGEVESGYNYYF